MAKNIEKTTVVFLEKEDEEEPAEEWCFGCKDGGQMIICDHPNCGKVYHPDCVGKDAAFFDIVKSWFCGRHACFQCNEPSKFYCLACPIGVCRKCFAASEEFTVVRGVKGLCMDCWKLMEIVEQNLDHDSNGNKIALNDRETYECLFKEYWEIIKAKERLTREDVFSAQPDFRTCKPFQYHKKNRTGEEEEVKNELKEGLSSDDIFSASLDYKKFEPLLHHKKVSKTEEEVQNEVKEGLTGDDTFAAQTGFKKFKGFLHHKKISKVEEEESEEEESEEEESEEEEGEAEESEEEEEEEESEEEENDLRSWTSDEDSKSALQSAKRKRSNSEEFVGWGSKPLIGFLASIGKHETEPLTKWAVNSLIHEYINEKSLDHPRDKGKFLPDERLFPVFRKKVVSKRDIYYLLGFHFAKKMDDPSEDKNNVQISNSSLDKHPNAKKICGSRLSSLIGKPPLRKGDYFIKHSQFASINAYNIKLIYLKRSLVLELSKQPESLLGKIVGTFVRARMDSNDSRQGKSYHLVRVLGVEFDEMPNRILLQVSLMPKAIPISVKSLERFSYINSVVYPLTSVPLIAYCALPAVCLLTGKFIVPEISNYASIIFMALFISIAATGILEMQWGGVGIHDWWRNEQFWVIGGASSHLFALFQGLLKVLAGVNTNFTVTSKAADDGDFAELYIFKWTSLLIPPLTLLIINIIGVIVGVSDAINNGYDSWGPLFGRLFFALWVIVHLYPFLKGVMGKQEGVPTIILVWAILLASILTLLWVRINPFLAKNDIVLEICGLKCD